MTLLDLAIHIRARVDAIHASDLDCVRLHALGICVGSQIHKPHESLAYQPIVIATQHQCTIALSRTLAAKIFITPE